MAEIDVGKELKKYQQELSGLISQLQAIENQKAILIQGIAERRGIIIYLQSLDQHKEEKSEG